MQGWSCMYRTESLEKGREQTLPCKAGAVCLRLGAWRKAESNLALQSWSCMSQTESLEKGREQTLPCKAGAVCLGLRAWRKAESKPCFAKLELFVSDWELGERQKANPARQATAMTYV